MLIIHLRPIIKSTYNIIGTIIMIVCFQNATSRLRQKGIKIRNSSDIIVFIKYSQLTLNLISCGELELKIDGQSQNGRKNWKF